MTLAHIWGRVDESQVVRLKTQLVSVELLFSGATPERIDRRPVSGNWSARENLAHIGRYHEIFLERLHHILTEQSPQFARYRAEEDPGWQEWQSRNFEEIRTELVALRLNLIDKITALQPLDYNRDSFIIRRNDTCPLVGIFPHSRGASSVCDFAEVTRTITRTDLNGQNMDLVIVAQTLSVPIE